MDSIDRSCWPSWNCFPFCVTSTAGARAASVNGNVSNLSVMSTVLRGARPHAVAVCLPRSRSSGSFSVIHAPLPRLRRSSALSPYTAVNLAWSSDAGSIWLLVWYSNMPPSEYCVSALASPRTCWMSSTRRPGSSCRQSSPKRAGSPRGYSSESMMVCVEPSSRSTTNIKSSSDAFTTPGSRRAASTSSGGTRGIEWAGGQ
mmetsp:Transcript_36143/g.111373  ORF Transcript_36143/g.111373 Transcript_36143/m.111373 type:complete len:201 (-) Transcript_36143:18-620(-)